MNLLGSYLKAKRNEKGLSLNDVYNQTGLTDSRVSKLENNSYKEPSPIMLKTLAELYEISTVELFIKAGYLTYDSLDLCSQIFHGIELLKEEDKKHIQEQIDYLASKNKKENSQ